MDGESCQCSGLPGVLRQMADRTSRHYVLELSCGAVWYFGAAQSSEPGWLELLAVDGDHWHRRALCDAAAVQRLTTKPAMPVPDGGMTVNVTHVVWIARVAVSSPAGSSEGKAATT